MNKTDVLFELEIGTDVISRSYAIEQIDMAIAEASDDEEKAQFERFKDFITALPTHKGVFRSFK